MRRRPAAAEVMDQLAWPIEQAHNFTVVQLKTQSGCTQWMVDMAQGAFEVYLGEVVGVVCSEGFFREAGFFLQPPCDVEEEDAVYS